MADGADRDAGDGPPDQSEESRNEDDGAAATDRSNVLTGYLSVLSGDIGRILVFAAFVPLLVRTVGDAGFGTYAFVMALFLPLRKLLNFGLFEATKTYASRAEGAERRSVVATSLLLHLGMLVVLLPTVAVAVTLFAADEAVRHSLYLLLGALAGEQFYYFGRGVLHAHKREAVVEPLIPLRSVILAAVGLWLAANGWGVPGVFAGFATGFLLTGLASTALAIRASSLSLPSRSDLRAYAPALLTFGAPSMVLVLLNVGLYKIDILLVSYYMTPTDTGYYRGAIQIAEFIWVVSLAMEMVMIQSTSELWADGRVGEITDLLSQALRYVVVFTVLLSVGVFALGESFLTVYFGANFTESVLPLRVLLPGVLGFAVARVTWPVVQAGGHLRGIVAATGVAVALNVALNVALIPRIGILGAAVATSVSYGLMGVLHAGVARTVGVAPFAGFPAVRVVGLGAVTLGVLLALEPLVPWYLDLGLLPFVGLAVYAVGVVKLDVIAVSEVTDLIGQFTADAPAEG